MHRMGCTGLVVAPQQHVGQLEQGGRGRAFGAGEGQRRQSLIRIVRGALGRIVARPGRLQQRHDLADERRAVARPGVEGAQVGAALQSVEDRQRLLAGSDVGADRFADQFLVAPDAQQVS